MNIFIWRVWLLFLLVACTSGPTKTTANVNSTADSHWAFPHFKKVDSVNPILSPSQDLDFVDPITGQLHQWEARNVLNPTAVVRNDSVYLLYRAQDSMGTSRIGIAVSHDGLHFTKMPQPVFYPDEDAQKTYEWNFKKFDPDFTPTEVCVSCYFDGVEDPRIVESPDGTYIMTYTAYDGKTARLALASSSDLIHWTKHGLVLNDVQFQDTWSKSGAIVAKQEGNRIIAKKIDGYYWMYYGDTDLFMMYSEDLMHWQPALNAENNKRIQVLHPRAGMWDSRLVEPGPYALLKEEGILLIYNGSNAANYNDPKLPKFTYAAGQALFDAKKPHVLKDREQDYFIYPDKDYERIGEVNEVCFVEGLVFFKGHWFLYYGTADSKIAVAVYAPNKP